MAAKCEEHRTAAAFAHSQTSGALAACESVVSWSTVLILPLQHYVLHVVNDAKATQGN